MARHFSRPQRVGEQIQKELADLIRAELHDPRLTFVTIMNVDVSNDYSYAKVYFSVLTTDKPAELKAVQKSLQESAGYLRGLLGKRMKLRVIPQLQFVHDAIVEKGVYMTHLIDEAVASGQVEEN